MKKFILPAIAALALSACATTQERPDIGIAPAAKVPQLPASLHQKAERLPDITDPTLGGIHKDGAATDAKYNDLAFRYNFLIDAWDCVATAINNRQTSNLDKCLAGEGSAK